MSYQAVKAVLKHSQTKHSGRLVMLCYAEHADPNGENTWLSYETLEAEANLRREAVARGISQARDLGELEQTGMRPSGTPVYRIALMSSETELPQTSSSSHSSEFRVASSPIGEGSSVLAASGSHSEHEPSEPPLKPSKPKSIPFPKTSEEEKVVDALETAVATLHDNPSKRNRERLQRHVADLKDELGTEVEISAWADELLGAAA